MSLGRRARQTCGRADPTVVARSSSATHLRRAQPSDSGQSRNQNWLYFGRIDHPAGSKAFKQQLYIRLRYGEAAFAAAELAATRNLRRDITPGVNNDPANFDIAVLGIEADETPRAPVPSDVILAHQIRTA